MLYTHGRKFYSDMRMDTTADVSVGLLIVHGYGQDQWTRGKRGEKGCRLIGLIVAHDVVDDTAT